MATQRLIIGGANLFFKKAIVGVFASKVETKFFIIYDGECGICNYFAGWVIKNCSNNVFKALSYQKMESEILPKGYTLGLARETILVVENSTHKVYATAEAIFVILKQMKRFWGIVGRLFSNKLGYFMFNPLYRFVARNRSRISRILGLQNCRID